MGLLELCFYSIATDPPVIGSISVVQVDPQSYDASSAGNGSVLVNYGRLDYEVGQWRPDFSNDTELFFRSWQSDYDYRTASTRKIIDAMSKPSTISGAEKEPNYFPMKLYQTSVTVSGTAAANKERMEKRKWRWRLEEKKAEEWEKEITMTWQAGSGRRWRRAQEEG